MIFFLGAPDKPSVIVVQKGPVGKAIFAKVKPLQS